MNDKRKQILDRLTGGLIGLARATEGNEYKLDDDTAAAVKDGLTALFFEQERSDDELLNLIDRVREEKRKLVPDCFVCKVSCGRNNDYDINNLKRADDEVQRLKAVILLGIQGLAVKAGQAAVPETDEKRLFSFLYKGLYSIGMDEWEKEDLLLIIMEMGELKLYLNEL